MQWIITVMTTKDSLSGLGSRDEVCTKGSGFWILGLLTVHKRPSLAATSGSLQAHLSGLAVS